jgi:hypothetical protein
VVSFRAQFTPIRPNPASFARLLHYKCSYRSPARRNCHAGGKTTVYSV